MRLDSYIECALWSSTGDNDEPLDRNFDRSNIDPETLKKMEEELNSFFQKLEEEGLLEEANKFQDDERISHDFWLTRNGHGAGFWDGDYADGDRLTAIAKGFGNVDLYVGDDGMIYQS